MRPLPDQLRSSSIEVLIDARAKAMQEVTPELYAVINPEDDPKLLFTPFEGMAIAQLFDKPTVDGGQGGTKVRVLAGMHGRTYVHFSCHGSYQWNDPPASGLHLADDRLTLADLQQGGVDLLGYEGGDAFGVRNRHHRSIPRACWGICWDPSWLLACGCGMCG